MKEVRASLRRHWTLAVLVLLVIPVVMATYLANRDVVRLPARYTTSADVLIPARDPETGDADPVVPPVLLQGQTELAASEEIISTAFEASGLSPEDQDGVDLTGVLSEDRTIMTLSVSAPTPDVAPLVLEEYITAYEDGRRASVFAAANERADIQVAVIGILNRKVVEVEADMATVEAPLLAQQPDGTVLDTPATLSEEGILLTYQRNAALNEIDRRRGDYALQVTVAAVPGDYSTTVQRRSTARITPPPPSPLVPLVSIVIGGLLLAILIPFLRDRLDPTITEARTAPTALRAGLLGTIPFMPRRLHHQLAPPGSPWDVAFRSLAATSLSTDRLPKALMVTSPTGNTQDRVAANFAAGLARLGVSVALIGTMPDQSWFLVDAPDEDDPDGLDETTAPFGADPAAPRTGGTVTGVPTLPDLLQDAEAGRLAGNVRARLGTRGIPNLYVIPPGPPGSALESLDGLPPLLEALSNAGIDTCVIAGPALLDDPNATIMAWSTRHVLWAVEMGQVNKNDAQLAADRVELAGVTPFGIALVNRHALRT